MVPKHGRHLQAGVAVLGCANVMFTHVLKCLIIAGFWTRRDWTLAFGVASCCALREQLSLCLYGFRWYECGRFAERGVRNVWRRARFRARGGIVVSGTLCA